MLKGGQPPFKGDKMNKKGFTLIELAIVLVIIGIILGAVLKGQDIIRNARAKKLIAQIQKWEAFTWSFMDQKGRFPGDGCNNGIIGDQTSPVNEQSNANSAIQEILNEKYTNPPTETIKLGSTTFYVKAGFYTDGSGKKYNLIALCSIDKCNGPLDADAIKYAEFVDTSIDGEANAKNGLVRGGKVKLSDTGNYIVIDAGLSNDETDYAGAIIYFFDKKP